MLTLIILKLLDEELTYYRWHAGTQPKDLEYGWLSQPSGISPNEGGRRKSSLLLTRSL